MSDPPKSNRFITKMNAPIFPFESSINFEAASAVEKAATQYIEDRQKYGTKTYPELSEQLDQLFRDVAAGKFGADAQTGEWYNAIKEVKDTNPKP